MKTTIKTIPLPELEVEISYNYHKGFEGRWYGDVPEPPEPASVEIVSIKLFGIDITQRLDEMGFDFQTLEDEILCQN